MCLTIFSLVACRPDTLLLTYRYPGGTVATYEMRAEARATWRIGGGARESGSYEVAYDVTETVLEEADEQAVVAVEMDPVSVRADGLPAPDRGVRSFTLRLGPRGQVLEILDVDGIPAQDLEPDELAFIGTYRPPLPADEVRIDERWQSQQEFQLESVFQQLLVIGRLEALNRDGAGRFARLTYRGNGPLVWTIELPGGNATLTGDATTQATAAFDLDAGALRTARSTTDGSFGVRVLPTDEVSSPLTGNLSFAIDVDLRRTISAPVGTTPQPTSSAPTTT